MAVFVEAGRGRREWEARKSISGAVRGDPEKAVQAGRRGKRLMPATLLIISEQNINQFITFNF